MRLESNLILIVTNNEVAYTIPLQCPYSPLVLTNDQLRSKENLCYTVQNTIANVIIMLIIRCYLGFYAILSSDVEWVKYRTTLTKRPTLTPGWSSLFHTLALNHVVDMVGCVLAKEDSIGKTASESSTYENSRDHYEEDIKEKMYKRLFPSVIPDNIIKWE